VSETTETLRDLAEQLYASTVKELGLGSDLYSPAVHDAAADYKAAVDETVAAGRQLEADAAELYSKRDLIPEACYRRLQREMIAEAEERASGADLRTGAALERLRAAIDQDALPRLDPSREALARQELSLAVGEAQGSAAMSRVVTLAERGSREAAAALFSQFGSSLLEARGLTGRDHAEALQAARDVAAGVAAERGETATEILAGQARQSVGKLGAVKSAAGSYTLRVIEEAEKL
jgi:hypothetical protein